MVELRDQNLVDAELHAAGRARQQEHVRRSAQSGIRAALNRGGSDLGERQLTKQLAEAWNVFRDQRREGLGGNVAWRDAGSAGRDYHVDTGVRDPPRQLAADLCLDVLDDHVADYLMSDLAHPIGDVL